MIVPSTIGRSPAVFFGLVAALTLMPLLHGSEEAQPLRLRWTPGYTYIQETTTATTTGLTALGQAEDQHMEIKQTTRVDVSQKDAGIKEARVSFTSLLAETVFKGKRMAFDSAHPAEGDPVLRKSLGQTVGSSFVLIYDQDDRFTGVRDTGSMAPSSDGSPTLPGIVESKEVAELYRRSLEMGLPKTAVKPGDRWTSQETVKFPSAGTVNVELRAKFETIADVDGRRQAKVVFEGDMKGAGESGGRIAIGAGSTTAGQILFDLEAGTVSFAAFRADIRLEIDGKRIPVRQEVTTKLVSLKPTPPKE